MYTVKQVVAMTGLTAATLRIWERRYGVVNPRRTAGHYRMYSEGDVARLRAMVQLVEAGATAGKAAEIVITETLSEPAPVEAKADPGQVVVLAERFDMDGLADLLAACIPLKDFEWAMTHWVTPAFVELRQALDSGRLTRAHVHMAERAMKRRLGTLLDQTRVRQQDATGGSDVRPLVLVGQEEAGVGEIIPLGFTIALRQHQVDARYLGGSVGHDGWLAAATQMRPRAVAIAVSTPQGVDAAQALAAELAALRPPIMVWLGGPELKPRRGVRGMLPMDTARATRTVLNHLLAGSVRPGS